MLDSTVVFRLYNGSRIQTVGPILHVLHRVQQLDQLAAETGARARAAEEGWMQASADGQLVPIESTKNLGTLPYAACCLHGGKWRTNDGSLGLGGVICRHHRHSGSASHATKREPVSAAQTLARLNCRATASSPSCPAHLLLTPPQLAHHPTWSGTRPASPRQLAAGPQGCAPAPWPATGRLPAGWGCAARAA